MAKSILFVTATRIGDSVLSMGILGENEREYLGDDLKDVDVLYSVEEE